MSFAPADGRATPVNPFAGRDVNWLLDFRAGTRGDHPFLVWEPFEGAREVWTYARFRDRVLRVAAGLRRRGVKAGDSVLVHLDNAPEMEFLWFACARLGAVVVTTNTRSAGDELAYFAEHCGAVGAVTQPELAAVVAANAKNLKWLVVTEHLVEGGEPPAELRPAKADAFSSLDGDPHDLPAIEADPWRPGSVQYTSGTTSRPKGVLWTQGNALWGARTSAIHQTLTPDDVHHVVMPSFHTNARSYSILPTMWAGGTVVIQPKFSARRFWDVALRNRCTFASTLPFFCKALMEHPLPTHHFRLFGNGVNEPPFDDFFGVRSIGWWGMTETVSQGIVGDALLRNRPMTTGRPAAGYGIRILREDLKTPVEPGEIGHLQCHGTRGIQIFLEYLNNPKATAESFTEDGWFITGDRVKLEEDGVLTFSDRDKDMLKVGGENVAASEIERVIALVPGVQECAVVAQKHRMLDEVPVAFVIPTPDVKIEGNNELPARIMAECAAKLADFKRPRQVLLVPDMPRSTLEKVHKVALRERLPVAG
ncbi:MAG: AMP-binding protein [Rhodospirillales bacterium]|nr:MAG: AMP-binding protein [Rhodospirillales bacterium]